MAAERTGRTVSRARPEIDGSLALKRMGGGPSGSGKSRSGSISPIDASSIRAIRSCAVSSILATVEAYGRRLPLLVARFTTATEQLAWS